MFTLNADIDLYIGCDVRLFVILNKEKNLKVLGSILHFFHYMHYFNCKAWFMLLHSHYAVLSDTAVNFLKFWVGVVPSTTEIMQDTSSEWETSTNWLHLIYRCDLFTGFYGNNAYPEKTGKQRCHSGIGKMRIEWELLTLWIEKNLHLKQGTGEQLKKILYPQ